MPPPRHPHVPGSGPRALVPRLFRAFLEHGDSDGLHDPTDSGTRQRVAVSFGPDHAPLEQRQVEGTWHEALTLNPLPDLLVFAAFQFDPEAAKDIDEMDPALAGVQFLKAQMNADLLTEDLKRKRSSNESFWLIGQPDVDVRRLDEGEHAGKWQVEVHGFDYFNTRTGGVESGGSDHIAVWMLDPDYDGRSLFPEQVFFPIGRCARRVDAAGSESQGGDRHGPDRGVPGDGVLAIRGG